VASVQNITDFKLNSKVLFDKIEAIKKNPPPEVLEFKAAHPEFKTVNCALLAEFIGLSEKTLTNLKLGKLTDSNCSTIWLICNSLGIDLRDYFGIPRQSECNPDTCSSHAQARLDEKRQRIAELEALYRESDRKLVDLNCIIREQCESLGEAKAKASGFEALFSEKKKEIDIRNRIILGLASTVLVITVAFVCLLLASIRP
jgi:DNA-binding Xre family transcriptional regulator